MANKLTRRKLIEKYLEYDSIKKNKTIDINNLEINWDDPNLIDSWLSENGYKHGIISGFETWELLLNFTVKDLGNCAIVNNILISSDRRLSSISNLIDFNNWEPDRTTKWHVLINRNEDIAEHNFFILRPTVNSEQPAQYYIEDGSGHGDIH